ncbi:MAG: helicase associated domain-containing protein [Cloacibacillus porcorum]|uniref:helicase associated domain-containing protein n=1 Tax=Cloacibacillus porcorum TaxID=1197717 RepID=UPI0023F28C9E|nr:helicase associated domain-containing protein [Cloacibacillus porcorum]MCD7876427.1 helicase associated domain-containing protein [Cloacibacillus porcorum]
MRSVIDRYQIMGDEKRIVNDSFTIIDEVRDSRRLFNELEESLSASWETMFGHAQAYYREHGNLEVSKRYQPPDGYSSVRGSTHSGSSTPVKFRGYSAKRE